MGGDTPLVGGPGWSEKNHSYIYELCVLRLRCCLFSEASEGAAHVNYVLLLRGIFGAR